MKKGTGDDPFADDVEADEQDTTPAFEPTELPADEDRDTLEPPHDGRDDPGVPWVYRRDNVKTDRDMVQFYLRQFVQDAEDDLVDDVRDRLGTDVSLTDIREAAYVAAMRDPQIVAAELERWGFESE